jgi:glucose/arabinose dehydrogenase
MRIGWASLVGVAAASIVLSAAAQQDVPMRNGIPVAPTGLVVPPLPEHPVLYDTAEGQTIRVVVVAQGLEQPWSIAFLPGGDLLVTERPGRLRLIRGDRLVDEPVEGVPVLVSGGISAGLFDVVLHPDFESNRLVYLAYTKALPDEGNRLAIARGRWEGNRLVGTEDILVTTGGSSRMAFGSDGMLYLSAGSDVLRVTPDGKVPPDNPFVGEDSVRPEVFTQGHRSTIGLAVHPGTGEIWQSENGPNGGDEINVLKAGANYGWPAVSLGRDYEGKWHSERFQQQGFEDPIVYWMPSIAVSGLAFYTGDALPRWKGDVFVGGLRTGEIPGTGHVERILFNQDMQELRRESLLVDLRQRIRDIRMGPDELLYVLTGEDEGAVLRIEPGD